jgi:ribonuclease Z
VTWLVQCRPINDPFSDPGIFIDFRFGRRALLFDLGDLTPLSGRELLRVTHAFVSHTHMDHFGGFDRLLRACLHRAAPLHLVGPAGFVDQVESRLRSYTWNLLGTDSCDFVLTACELGGNAGGAHSEFRAREAFRRCARPAVDFSAGILLDEQDFRIESVVLDHGTPCLAFALQEKLRMNVWKEGLDALGLPVGAWLNEAKRAVRRGAADAELIAVDGQRSVPLGLLRQHALRTAPGQRIAYVVDAAHEPANVARIVGLARGADQLFIETTFLQEDAALAAERRHLTAMQAGAIARMAAAAQLIPMHFSGRYLEREDELRREAQAAFQAAGGCASS